MEDPNDLVSAAIAGDRRAWAKLYRRLSKKLDSYFRRNFPSSDSDELVSATLEAVLAKLHTFEDRGDSAFMRWVYGFARYEAQMAMRSRERREARHVAFGRDEPSPETSPITKLELVQQLSLVLRQAERLSVAQQRAIKNDLRGGNAKSLAKKQAISNAAARMLQTRARRKLNKLVRERMANPRPRTPAPTPKRPSTRTPTPTPTQTR